MKGSKTRHLRCRCTYLRCNNCPFCLVCRNVSSLSLPTMEIVILSDNSDEQHKRRGSAYPAVKGMRKVKAFSLVIE